MVGKATVLVSRLRDLAANAESWSSKHLLSSAGPALLLVSFASLEVVISRQSTAAEKEHGGTHLHLVGATIFSTLSFVCVCRLLLSTSSRQTSVYFSLVGSAIAAYLHLNVSRGSGAVAWRTWYGASLLPHACNHRLHSALLQVLSIGAVPRVLEAFGSRFLLLRLLDVLAMFALGLLAVGSPLVASPLHECSALDTFLPAVALGLALGLGLRVGYLVHFRALRLALR